jgi:hypothetical protein
MRCEKKYVERLGGARERQLRVELGKALDTVINESGRPIP